MFDIGRYNIKKATDIIVPPNKMEGEQHHIDKAACMANMFHFFYNAAKSCLYPFLALYLGRIGLSATQVGTVFGVHSIVSMITIPQWTSCAKFLNKKRLLLVFSVLCLILSYLSLSILPPAIDNICSSNDPDVGLNKTANSTIHVSSFTILPPSMHITLNYETTPLNNRTSTTSMSDSTTSAPIMTENEMISGITTMKMTGVLDEEDIAAFEELGLSRAKVLSMSTDDLIKFLKLNMDANTEISENTHTPKHHNPNMNGRSQRDVIYDYMDQLSKTLAKWQGISNSKQYHTFIYVMLLLILSAIFASPLDKLADDCWFEYLDVMERLEKYEHHRTWGLVGSAITPVVVSFMVVQSDCLLGDVVYHMVIHFYSFIMLLVIVLCMTCYYPISQYKKTSKKTYMFKGIRLLCGDCHAFSLTICMFIYGMVYACLFNFLFWRMSELDQSELPMGAAVTIAGLSELVLSAVYSSCGKCTKNVSQSGSVVFAFTILALRLILYSFTVNPWVVLAGEAFHGCSSTLLQLTIENYPDFRISILAMDRSASTVLRSLFWGLGYGIGCFLSGMLYDLVGFQMLYQGAAALCVVWTLIFVLINCCCKKKEHIMYTKLLSSDEADEDGDAADSMYDEDWLDVALERHS